MAHLADAVEKLRIELEKIRLEKQRIVRKRIKIVASITTICLVFYTAYHFLNPELNKILSTISKVDKIVEVTDKEYHNILKDSIMKEERKELSEIKNNISDVYKGPFVGKSRVKRVEDLSAKIKNTLLAEQLYDNSINLLEKGSYDEANSKIDRALGILPEEKKYQELNKRIENSIQRLANANKKLKRVKIDFEEKPHKKKELESILASLSSLYDGLVIDKNVEENVKGLKNQMNVAISYYFIFNKIKQDVEENKYKSDEEIRTDILKLAADLEKKTQPTFRVLLEEAKSYTHTKLVKVDAKYEKKLVKEGHYEEISVPLEQPAPITKFPKVMIKAAIGLVAAPFTSKENFQKLDNWIYGEKKPVWHDPIYEDILISPAHYQKIEVNLLSGKEKIIQDNIPIK